MAIIKHTDDGETKIETPEKGASFEIYLKSAGSYDAANKDAVSYTHLDVYKRQLRCKGLRLQNKDRRNLNPCRGDNTPLKITPDTPGEVPWTDRHRHQIPSEICRPYHESGEQRGIYQALTDTQGNP